MRYKCRNIFSWFPNTFSIHFHYYIADLCMRMSWPRYSLEIDNLLSSTILIITLITKTCVTHKGKNQRTTSAYRLHRIRISRRIFKRIGGGIVGPPPIRKPAMLLLLLLMLSLDRSPYSSPLFLLLLLLVPPPP